MKCLPMKTGNSELNKIIELLLGSKLIGFEIPKNQSLSCTWSLRLFFENCSDVLCCSSDVASAGNGDWQEYGFLKLDITDESSLGSRDKFNFREITPIAFTKVSKLVNNEDDVVAECGLLMTTEEEKQVVISTAPAPGAVTVKAEFYDGEYDPEILFEDLQQTKLNGQPLY
ncbi:hypothetical protein PSI9734_01372 [Pseudidiomarina piscicola]|uniref:Uncharacterized protein n=1 Tax=Pseudidiomarina piscicola TaxID=2614830 RepID=A0A6S6WJS3_9GAMM|nr:hypothetical protein [Pseudidiomarina piscicola]CAB0150933.1 hypothetical protein PSI9734_01372 [Pseudidiomarina piscicola]VZT40439.1 hypothetical protein PSI9734_01372 [Pseudomonas aeruginosa]